MGSETTNLPEALMPISWLAGNWSTKEGRGSYPTIKDFEYHEEVEFICIGQPMFNYSSLTKHPEKQTPMHQERGFLRIKPGSTNVALVLSHNFGLTSLEEGIIDVDKKEITLKSTDITRIAFAKSPKVTSIERVIKLLDKDTLEQTVFMATENTSLTQHLKAVYKRK